MTKHNYNNIIPILHKLHRGWHYKSTLLFLVIFMSTSISPMVVRATPGSTNQPNQIGFLGENPSGRQDRNGSPFISKSAAISNSPSAQTTPAATFTAECPSTIKCVVVPAAYSPNNGDVTDYGNYDKANRPTDMGITSIVLHTTEGSLKSVLDAFQDPAFYASSHYVIDADGTVYQMVPTKDIAWHAGNWSMNMHSIGIEHVGFSADSHSFTPAMYKSSTELVKYLTDKFHIPRDRGHIIGHDNVPGASSAASVTSMHVDPGPFWNWQQYMTLLHAPVLPTGGLTSGFVTVAPVWPLNKLAVTGCSLDVTPPSCVPSGAQSTNFVYLYTEPRTDVPYITDPVIGQGTTDITNNAARLFHGQTFGVADSKITLGGIWLQVWVNGIKGWFYSPWSAPTAFPASANQSITPKEGLATIPVYGHPFPERSEYPADLLAVPPASWYIPAQTPLPYTLSAGQRYHVVDANVATDYYYAWTSDSSYPYDHTDFHGATKYYEVQVGNRLGFVKASDVDIK